jgi:hypothetical protein
MQRSGLTEWGHCTCCGTLPRKPSIDTPSSPSQRTSLVLLPGTHCALTHPDPTHSLASGHKLTLVIWPRSAAPAVDRITCKAEPSDLAIGSPVRSMPRRQCRQGELLACEPQDVTRTGATDSADGQKTMAWAFLAIRKRSPCPFVLSISDVRPKHQQSSILAQETRRRRSGSGSAAKVAASGEDRDSPGSGAGSRKRGLRSARRGGARWAPICVGRTQGGTSQANPIASEAEDLRSPGRNTLSKGR